MSAISWAVEIRPREGRLTGLLLLLCFLLGAVRVYLNTAALALFLVLFGAKTLPYLFIGSALASALTGYLFSKLQQRLSLSKLLTVAIVSIILSVAVLRLLLLQKGARWPTMTLAILNEVIFVIAGLAFWALAEQLFDVRQAKRLFGFIGTGEVAAAIIGGLTLPLLVSAVGTANLLLVSGLAAVASMVVLKVIVRSFGEKIDEEKAHEEAGHVKPAKLSLRDRYFLLIILVCALNTIGFFVVDTAFFAEAEKHFPNENKLAGFLGVIEAIGGAVTLAARTFLTGRVLSQYGVSVGLLALPFVISVGTVAIAGAGSFLGAGMAVFWLMVVTKISFHFLHESLDQPSVLVLYQPLPAHFRLWAQTFVETISDPLALGMTGVGLLLFELWGHIDAVHLSYVMLFVIVLWIVVGRIIGREYLVALNRALAKRQLGDGSLLIKNRSMTAALEKDLRSRHPGEVIYSLGVLEELGHETLPTLLEGVLAHPDQAVRRDALARIERLRLTALAGRVLERVERDEAPEVRAAALRTFAALGEGDPMAQLAPYLDDPDPLLRIGALVGLLRGGDVDGVLAAAEALRDLASSCKVTDRQLVAQAIGESGIAGLARSLAALLQDKAVEVRREALAAAGPLRSPRLWPLVVQALSVPALRNAAARALVAGGETVLPVLSAVLRDESQPREIRLRVLSVCARIDGEHATTLLMGQLDAPDAQVRRRILAALSARGYRAEGEVAYTVRSLIRDEVAASVWTMAALIDFKDGEAAELLRRALAAEMERHRDRLLLLLSLIYPPGPILQVRSSLASESIERRAYALEVLDNVLAREHRELIAPLLDDTPPERCLERLCSHFPAERLVPAERLMAIVARSIAHQSPWTKACAIQLMGERPADACLGPVLKALADTDAVVRETAVWALARLAPDGLAARLEPLTTDAARNVAAMARSLLGAVRA